MEEFVRNDTVSFGGWRYWGNRVGGVGGFLSRRPEYGTIAKFWDGWQVFLLAGGSAEKNSCALEGLDGGGNVAEEDIGSREMVE